MQDSGSLVSIPVGIAIGLLASFVQSLGLTIQRKSHVLNQEVPEEQRRVEHRRPLWLLGFGIFISSNILGSVFQIASLPVVILAPLGAVSLLWNALFARLILGDVLSRHMIFGTLFIVAGAVLIARFGIVPEPTHSLEDLLALFRRDAFIIYFSLLGTAVVIALIATHILEWSVTRRSAGAASQLNSSSLQESAPFPIPLTTTTPNATERTPLLDPKLRRSPSPAPSSSSTFSSQRPRGPYNLIAVSYASASGILSGMCLLFAKSGVELLLLTFEGKNQFWRWESWALVGGLIVFALLQLWYLHKSLVLADPKLVCPLAFCFYNLSSIVNGLVYYDQLNLLSPLHLSLVILGIFILLAGVWAVSVQTEVVEDDESEDGATAVGGLREGDWIPADEEGVAPAVAPADIVRVAERVTGTQPELHSDDHGQRDASDAPVNSKPRLSPITSNSDPALSQHWPLIHEANDDEEVREPSPTSHIAATASHSRPPRTPISPSRRPRFSSLLSGNGEDQPVPGFSIGLSPKINTPDTSST
ncbi:hypothetical protein FRC03_000501 [Tulasnella sp. 419]|nr:hypothetical protein FRC03_000501 [Tulasnella sp. 419]